MRTSSQRAPSGCISVEERLWCWRTAANSPRPTSTSLGQGQALLASLCELAGAESDIHETTGYYLDVIPAGLFPQASAWRKRATRVHIPGTKRIELKVLELHDLILSKLRRFLGKDRQDIKALCDRSGFDIHVLRARYRDARLIYDYDEREAMDRNFRFIETEFLALEPTPDFD